MNSPFKFLDAYEKEDKDIFFGREKESKARLQPYGGQSHDQDCRTHPGPALRQE